MRDKSDSCCGERSAVVLVVGALAALAVAGIIGRSLYAARHPADQVRDVSQIISECQSTISQMDGALRALHSHG